MFTRIHHVGLVVPKLEDARRLWSDVYGFPVAGYGMRVGQPRSVLPPTPHVSLKDVTILDVAVGDSTLEFTEPKDPNSGTSRYMAERGPGPHHLCLATSDIEGDVQRLQNGGLRLLVPPVGLPGQKDVGRIAFFHPSTNLGVLLELWEELPRKAQPRASTPSRGRRFGGIKRLHHVGIVAPSIQEAHHLLCDVYGLKVDGAHSPPEGRHAAFDNVRVLDIPVGDSEIEVIVPQDATSGTARFLASRGPGVHHLCFYAEDVEGEMRRLTAAGLQQIGSVGPGALPGSKVGWLHPKGNLGILVELWQDLGKP